MTLDAPRILLALRLISPLSEPQEIGIFDPRLAARVPVVSVVSVSSESSAGTIEWHSNRDEPAAGSKWYRSTVGALRILRCPDFEALAPGFWTFETEGDVPGSSMAQLSAPRAEQLLVSRLVLPRWAESSYFGVRRCARSRKNR